MPVKSKAQERLFQGIAHGSIKPKPGQPSRATAQEFVSKPPRGKLPERVHPKQGKKG